MSGDLDRIAVTPTALTVAETVGDMLPRGHVIHGFSDASNVRVVRILASREYSDGAPLLGYGEDGTAERALARALATYVMREQMGLGSIQADRFPESAQGSLPPGDNSSRFDVILWGGDFKLYQDGDEFVAASSYGGGRGGGHPSEVRAASPLGAIVELTGVYQFGNDSVLELPPTAFDQL